MKHWNGQPRSTIDGKMCCWTCGQPLLGETDHPMLSMCYREGLAQIHTRRLRRTRLA